MKKVRVLFLKAMLLFPILMPAARICVWNYDPVDRFYDAQIGDSVNCAYWVERDLTAQGHTVEVFDRYLPSDLSGYDLVYCLMGWFRT